MSNLRYNLGPLQRVISFITRMHSSRMHAGRSLTVCRSLLLGGGGDGGGGLDLIPLNFPLGCGLGPDPLNFPLGYGPGSEGHTRPPRRSPQEQTPSLGADTPQSRHPLDQTLPLEQTPRSDTLQIRHPLGADTPQCRHPPDQTLPLEQTPPGADTPTPWSRQSLE